MTDGFSFTIETRGPIANKVSHLCPFHQERNPSAVTFFKDNNRCFTYCSACKQRAWGQYEIVGNTVVVRVRGQARRVTNQKVSSVSASTPQNEEAEARMTWYRIIKKSVPPRETLSQDVLEFWKEYLRVKGIGAENLNQVEMRPVFFEFGIWFPVTVVDVLGSITRDPRFGVVRSIPYKSLNFFPDLSPSACAYIPYPSRLDNYSCVVVVESPTAAVRIALLGWENVIASLGTTERLVRNVRTRYKSIVIHDPDKGGKQNCDIAADIDKLPDDRIRTLMQIAMQQ